MSFTKTILNESIFQINITRIMFSLKTKKKKMYFLTSLAPICHQCSDLRIYHIHSWKLSIPESYFLRNRLGILHTYAHTSLFDWMVISPLYALTRVSILIVDLSHVQRWGALCLSRFFIRTKFGYKPVYSPCYIPNRCHNFKVDTCLNHVPCTWPT